MNIAKWLQYGYYAIIQRRNDPHPIHSFQDWLDYLDYAEWCESQEYEPSLEWLCHCGHFEDSGLHCSRCGEEPPWGCDCSFCDERYYSNDEDEWLWSWRDYPGDLLAGSIKFEEVA